MVIDLNGNNVVIVGQPQALANGITQSFKACGATVHRLNTPESPTPDDINQQINSIGQCDTLIILPALFSIGEFMDTIPEHWQAMLQQNYENAVYWSQAGAQSMIHHESGGSIIFVSTIAVTMPLMLTSAYATSLAMLYPLAKMAAVDCGKYNIRVNTVTAGWVEHEWTQAHLATEAQRAYITQGIPLGNIGDPAMIGDVCCFLASSLARYITGSIIPVDGGYTLTRSEGTTPYPTA